MTKQTDTSAKDAAAGFPAFTPTKYEIKSRRFESINNTGMIGTLEFYLPEIAESVWVNCHGCGIDVYMNDVIWDSDNSGGYDNETAYPLYSIEFGEDISDDAVQWLPMIKKALAYTIGQEAAEKEPERDYIKDLKRQLRKFEGFEPTVKMPL
jgi:hypothetical protein